MKPRSPGSSWFSIRAPLSARPARAVKTASFLLPLALWCAVSYVPWLWHPDMKITVLGGAEKLYRIGDHVPRAKFDELNAIFVSNDEPPMAGIRANPIFLPAPHEVFRAFYTAFSTPPSESLKGDLWLHQRLWHSIKIIFWGFVLSTAFGLPLGVLCGTFDFVSKLSEPVIDFIRYMPAPAFGALCVVVFDLGDKPKIAIIWIGTFFQMVLVIANTTRQLDVSLLEAAQTLGAKNRSLLLKVVLPGILPNLYNDMRILLGWAWTYLIVAELVGGQSGISAFAYQQGRYQQYDNVYVAIITIGIIGLVCDQFLATARPLLFPWLPRTEGATILSSLIGVFTFLPQRQIAARAKRRHAERAAASAKRAPVEEAHGATPSGSRAVPGPVGAQHRYE